MAAASAAERMTGIADSTFDLSTAGVQAFEVAVAK
ncbi:hypothetical protein ACVWW3_004121 [Bradyrhizobium sp. LM2.9]